MLFFITSRFRLSQIVPHFRLSEYYARYRPTKVQGAPPENQFLQTLVQFQLQRNIFIVKVICEQSPSYLSNLYVENVKKSHKQQY